MWSIDREHFVNRKKINSYTLNLYLNTEPSMRLVGTGITGVYVMYTCHSGYCLEDKHGHRREFKFVDYNYESLLSIVV